MDMNALSNTIRIMNNVSGNEMGVIRIYYRGSIIWERQGGYFYLEFIQNWEGNN